MRCWIDSIVESHVADWLPAGAAGRQAATQTHRKHKISGNLADLTIGQSNVPGQTAHASARFDARSRYGAGQPLCLVQKRMPPALQQIQPAFAHGFVVSSHGM